MDHSSRGGRFDLGLVGGWRCFLRSPNHVRCGMRSASGTVKCPWLLIGHGRGNSCLATGEVEGGCQRGTGRAGLDTVTLPATPGHSTGCQLQKKKLLDVVGVDNYRVSRFIQVSSCKLRNHGMSLDYLPTTNLNTFCSESGAVPVPSLESISTSIVL